MDSSENRPALRPFLRRIALFAFIIAAVLAAFQLWTRPPSFRRFVSQPLPDGSRYTFLYPAHLKNVNENGKGASSNITHNVNVTNRTREDPMVDRKSTRLNSSHLVISYAVFCLKTTK